MLPPAKLDASLSPAEHEAVSRLLTNDVFEVLGLSFLVGGRFSYRQLHDTIKQRASQTAAEAEKDKAFQVQSFRLVRSKMVNHSL